MKVLIVDDNENFRSALKTVLEFQNLFSRVDQCEDGDEVIPYLRENGLVDCIIMDISMKRLDGLSAAELVKKNYPDIPVIILSMHDEENYHSYAKQIGVNAFVLKNIDVKELFKVIVKVIGK